MNSKLREGYYYYYFRLPFFREEFGKGLPILYYHKLGFPGLHEENKELFVSPRLFARQLAELRKAGFESRNLGSDTTPGGVVITFDDGYASAFEQALEPLRKYGFRAMQFLVSGLLGKRSSWNRESAPLMDHAQVRDWLQAGHMIGAHTVSHPRLTQMDEASAREEITASRKFLEDAFGVPVKHFCYPYGNWSRRVADLVREAGFESATTTDTGVNTGNADPFALRRIHAWIPPRKPWGWYYYLRR